MFNKEKNVTEKRGRFNNKKEDPKRKKSYELVDYKNTDGSIVIYSTGVTVPIDHTLDADGRKHVFEVALRNFKKIVKDSGKLDELKNRQEFRKKSVINRDIRKKAIRKNNFSMSSNTTKYDNI